MFYVCINIIPLICRILFFCMLRIISLKESRTCKCYSYSPLSLNFTKLMRTIQPQECRASHPIHDGRLVGSQRTTRSDNLVILTLCFGCPHDIIKMVYSQSQQTRISMTERKVFRHACPMCTNFFTQLSLLVMIPTIDPCSKRQHQPITSLDISSGQFIFIQ